MEGTSTYLFEKYPHTGNAVLLHLRDRSSSGKRVVAAKRKAVDELAESGGDAVVANTESSKRQKEAYLVNRTKFLATATQEELHKELSLDSSGGGGIDQEDIHRIVQCKIR
jgi:hypothetical protein